MSHNTKYYRKKLKKTESSKKIDVLFRQQALVSENSANITPKQTKKVEASAEIATTNGKADFKICLWVTVNEEMNKKVTDVDWHRQYKISQLWF